MHSTEKEKPRRKTNGASVMPRLDDLVARLELKLLCPAVRVCAKVCRPERDLLTSLESNDKSHFVTLTAESDITEGRVE